MNEERMQAGYSKHRHSQSFEQFDWRGLEEQLVSTRERLRLILADLQTVLHNVNRTGQSSSNKNTDSSRTYSARTTTGFRETRTRRQASAEAGRTSCRFSEGQSRRRSTCRPNDNKSRAGFTSHFGKRETHSSSGFVIKDATKQEKSTNSKQDKTETRFTGFSSNRGSNEASRPYSSQTSAPGAESEKKRKATTFQNQKSTERPGNVGAESQKTTSQKTTSNNSTSYKSTSYKTTFRSSRSSTSGTFTNTSSKEQTQKQEQSTSGTFKRTQARPDASQSSTTGSSQRFRRAEKSNEQAQKTSHAHQSKTTTEKKQQTWRTETTGASHSSSYKKTRQNENSSRQQSKQSNDTQQNKSKTGSSFRYHSRADEQTQRERQSKTSGSHRTNEERKKSQSSSQNQQKTRSEQRRSQSYSHHSEAASGKMTLKSAYDVLCLACPSSPGEIKSAYRQQARRHHPDLGGDEEMMKTVNLAYEMLMRFCAGNNAAQAAWAA